jgi:hypothetical protein
MRILAIERPVAGVTDAQFTPQISAAEARGHGSCIRPARSESSHFGPTKPLRC